MPALLTDSRVATGAPITVATADRGPRASAAPEPVVAPRPIELVLVALAAAALLLVLRIPVRALIPGAFNDDGVYLALGRAIATGQGYHSIHLVGAPLHVKFPPALPFLLAALWRLLGSLHRVASVAVLLNVAAVGIASAMLWWLGRTRLALSRPALAAGLGVPLLLPFVVDYFTLVLSEPWFLLCWAGAILLVARASGRSDSALEGVAPGVAVALAVLFRTQAITLLPALALALLLARRRRAALGLTAAALLPIAAWLLWLARARAGAALSAAPDESGYLAWTAAGGGAGAVGAVARAASASIANYVEVLRLNLADGTAAGAALLGGAVSLAIAGAVRLWRRERGLVLSTAFAVALLVVWPSPQDRLLVALLPFVGLLSAAGAGALVARGGRAARALAPVVVALAVVAVVVRHHDIRGQVRLGMAGGGNAPRFVTSSFFLPRNSRDIALTAQWARSGARPGDRVLTAMPSGVWLLTGLQGAPAEPTESALERSVWTVPGQYLVRRIRDDGISVVVVDRPVAPIARDARLVMSRCPGVLRWVGGDAPGSFPMIFRVEAPADSCLTTVAASVPR